MPGRQAQQAAEQLAPVPQQALQVMVPEQHRLHREQTSVQTGLPEREPRSELAQALRLEPAVRLAPPAAAGRMKSLLRAVLRMRQPAEFAAQSGPPAQVLQTATAPQQVLPLLRQARCPAPLPLLPPKAEQGAWAHGQHRG